MYIFYYYIIKMNKQGNLQQAYHRDLNKNKLFTRKPNQESKRILDPKKKKQKENIGSMSGFFYSPTPLLSNQNKSSRDYDRDKYFEQNQISITDFDQKENNQKFVQPPTLKNISSDTIKTNNTLNISRYDSQIASSQNISNDSILKERNFNIIMNLEIIDPNKKTNEKLLSNNSIQCNSSLRNRRQYQEQLKQLREQNNMLSIQNQLLKQKISECIREKLDHIYDIPLISLQQKCKNLQQHLITKQQLIVFLQNSLHKLSQHLQNCKKQWDISCENLCKENQFLSINLKECEKVRDYTLQQLNKNIQYNRYLQTKIWIYSRKNYDQQLVEKLKTEKQNLLRKHKKLRVVILSLKDKLFQQQQHKKQQRHQSDEVLFELSPEKNR